MPVIYHRDDTGAPVPPTYGSTADYAFAAFKAVLKACLVTGYGSKPAAGWSLVAEGAGHLVLRSGSQSGYVCVTKTTISSGYYWRISVAATFDGVAADTIVGDGVKSGLGGSPQAVPGTNLAVSDSSMSWLVLADDRTAVVTWYATANATPSTLENDSFQGLSLYIGEDSAGNFLTMGGQNLATLPYKVFSSDGMTLLRDPDTGLLVDTGTVTAWDMALHMPGNTTGTKVSMLPELQLNRVHWYTAGGAHGFLRGVAVNPDIKDLYISHAAQSLGWAGTINSRTICNPFRPDGLTLANVLNTYLTGSRALVTDHGEFW